MAFEYKNCTDCDYCGEIKMVSDDGHGGKGCKGCLEEPGRTFRHWPAELVEAVETLFSSHDDDEDHPLNDPCVDNFRFARHSNAVEMAAFEDAKMHGCCGCWGEDVTVGDETISVGMNYGH